MDFPVVFGKLRSELISLVRQLQQEHCQSLQMCECLVSPSLVQRYPFDDLPDTDLFVIQDVAESILLQKKLICSQNKACKGLSTQSLLPCEPYHLFSPSYVCKLFNSDMANQPVPAPLLQEVQKHFHLEIPQDGIQGTERGNGNAEHLCWQKPTDNFTPLFEYYN